jgi:hypothetical protein
MENVLYNLPQVLADYVAVLAKRAGCGRKIQQEVAEELRCHFIDALAGCEGDEARERCAEELIKEFGDTKMLAKLIKRGKERCRPLWQKVLYRTVYCLGGLILFVVLYSVWFFTGRPTFSVNYLTKLNEMARPASFDPDENAWPYYEKAISLYAGADEKLSERISKTCGKEGYVSFTNLQESEQAAISAWLSKNTEAWAEFETGSRKPYCYREYNVGEKHDKDKPMLIAVLLPHLSELRDVARLGVWRAEKQLADSKSVEAAQTCLTLARVGRQWYEDRATLIEQLVAQAIVNMAEETMLGVIAGGNLSAEQTKSVRADMAGIFGDDYPYMTAIEMEGMIFEDTVQHTFTKGGPGGGHIVPKMFAQLGLVPEEELLVAGLAIVHAGRDKVLEAGEKLYTHLVESAKTSPYEKRSGKIKTTDEFLSSYNKVRYAFLWTLVPAVERVSTLRYQGKALHDATLTVLSLRQCQLEKGQLPETLDELVKAGYSKGLPGDPFSKGPLAYKKTGDDFVLYSLGEDFDDDNSRENPADPWGRKDTGGDRVFWPVR